MRRLTHSVDLFALQDFPVELWLLHRAGRNRPVDGPEFAIFPIRLSKSTLIRPSPLQHPSFRPVHLSVRWERSIETTLEGSSGGTFFFANPLACLSYSALSRRHRRRHHPHLSRPHARNLHRQVFRSASAWASAGFSAAPAPRRLQHQPPRACTHRCHGRPPAT